MMNFDALIDKFVEQVNASPRELLFDSEAPPSVRIGTSPDEVYGMWDWNIKRYEAVDWLEGLEARLSRQFPQSFRSLVARYIFPPFDLGPLQFLANTPEGVDDLYELRTGIFKDAYLSAGLLQNGFLQFARPAGGDYDPICFDPNGSIVGIDHESILCHDEIAITKVIALSFAELIERHLKGCYH
ncbi:MAG: SMI1/KNR4 family protein [Armatimonadetes bacterium]|nr:SMI1/KNR4 family protein [Armatimonadota bacterium]